MKIEHIALYVKDLETARNFFVKYLGAKSNEGYHNLKTSFRSYFLSFDDGARLEIMNKPEMPDFPKEFARTGYAHIAFSVGSKDLQLYRKCLNYQRKICPGAVFYWQRITSSTGKLRHSF